MFHSSNITRKEMKASEPGSPAAFEVLATDSQTLWNVPAVRRERSRAPQGSFSGSKLDLFRCKSGEQLISEFSIHESGLLDCFSNGFNVFLHWLELRLTASAWSKDQLGRFDDVCFLPPERQLCLMTHAMSSHKSRIGSPPWLHCKTT